MEKVFADLIRSLSPHLGTEIAVEGGTAASVDLGDFPLLIQLLPEAEQTLLAVAVAETRGGGEPLLRELLRGNYLYRLTGGAALSLDESGEVVCLQAVKDMRALTPDNFPVLVENFVHVAEYWRKRCLELTGDGFGAAGTSEAGKPSMTTTPGMIRG